MDWKTERYLGNYTEEKKEETKSLQLSNDQANALVSIKEWLFTPNEKPEDCFYSLTGSAGTGKTTLLASLMNDIKGNYKWGRGTCVSAPTHKAKKVVASKTKCPNGETVQALLGLKMDVDLENFDVTNPSFSPTLTKKMSQYKLILIDESSMINSDLYAFIKEDAIRGGIKILFIGDMLQLPPVNERYSQALIDPINKYELTEIIRQKNTNPLVELLGILRDDIINNTSNYLKFLEEKPSNMNDIEGYTVITGEPFGEKLAEAFKSAEYQSDKNYVRYIAWTNKTIGSANKYIRKHTVNSDNIITEGELLLSYKTISEQDGTIHLLNSDDYIVNKWSIDTDYRKIKVIHANLKSVDDDGISGKTLKIVYPDAKNYEIFFDERDDRLMEAKEKKGKYWPRYFEFRNEYLLLESIFEKENGKDKLKDKKDIDYGYGITIHKSQGSTYNTVFVNVKDIQQLLAFTKSRTWFDYKKFKSKDEEIHQAEIDVKKLIYVALSRASNKVYINI